MHETALKFKTILITGASSGIGEALALQYACVGRVLILTGRDEARLSGVAKRCQQKGAQVVAACIDVTDRSAMENFIHAQDDAHLIDLVIANAGVSAGTGGVLVGEDVNQVRHVFQVNVDGVLNTIEPLRSRMCDRSTGQIAIVSSLAGYRGWPGAPAYCGSKAAVRVYGEALRGSLAKTGVGVSVICPGFVESRITAVNEFSMPFLMDAGRAAKIIEKGLEKNKATLAFPLIPFMIARFLMMLPDGIAQKILAKTPSKKAKM